VRIAIIVEGATERVFIRHLKVFLRERVPGSMPHLDPFPTDHGIPRGDFLKRDVARLLRDGNDAVIALTDVYDGQMTFKNADDAKSKMREWVGDEPRFHPHSAQYEFEAWLLPYWPRIQELAGHNKKAPAGAPENVNHNKPPSHYIREVFRCGKRRTYIKTREANSILEGKDLAVAAKACPELRDFLNTILTLCGATPLS